MLVEGVRKGNLGALMWHREDMETSLASWNGRPITATHPQDAAGEFVSASTSPEIIDAYRIGVLMNASTSDGKLKAEAWIDVEKANTIDPLVVQNVKDNVPTEVSVGVLVQEEPAVGLFDGVSYAARAAEWQPDHLAILTKDKGACPLEAGAGLMVLQDGDDIEMKVLLQKKAEGLAVLQRSHEETRSALRDIFSSWSEEEPFLGYIWIADVYDTFVIVEVRDKHYMVSYTKDEEGIVTVPNETPVPVVPYHGYKYVSSGALVVNADPDSVTTTTKEDEMKKSQMIAALCSLPAFTGQEEALTSISDDAVTAMHNRLVVNASSVEDNTPTEPVTPTNVPLKQLLEMADEPTRLVVNAALHEHEEAGKACITKILACNAGWEETELQQKPLAELRKLVAMSERAAKSTEQEPEDASAYAPRPMYFGMGGQLAVNEGSDVEEDDAVLDVPSSF